MMMLAQTVTATVSPEEVALLGHAMYAGAICLILIGLYATVVERDLVRILFGLVLIGSAINLFIVATGYRPDAVAPILTGAMTATPMVDPIPQALVLTSIVIDVGVLALALALAIRVRDAFGTLDTREVQRRIAEAMSEEASQGRDQVPARQAGKPDESAPRKTRQLEEVS